MKTFKIKNYKGNIVESLKRFSESHKGMKIVEACEDGDNLKIKAEETEQKIEDGNDKQLVKDQLALASFKRIADILDSWEGTIPYIFPDLEHPNAKERNEFYRLCYQFFNTMIQDDVLANDLDFGKRVNSLRKAIQGLRQ